MKSSLLTTLIFLITFNLFGQQKQKALKYYDYVNNAEIAICDSDISSANNLYEKAFELTGKPYSTDLNNALNCALDLHKYAIAEKYFKMLLSRGIQLEALQFYLKSKDSSYITNWIKQYPNDTSKYRHPLRREFTKMSEKDQSVRAYFSKLNKDGNYMTDSVLKVDSINANFLYQLFITNGNTLPDEDLIGNFYNTPPYHLILLHHLQQKNKGDLFDTLMFQSIFDLSLHPTVYAPLAEAKFDSEKKLYYKQDSLQFPLSIFVAKFEEILFPEYFAPHVEKKINEERKKIGLCTLTELRKKIAFNYQHQQYKSFLSKYGFDAGIAGYLEATSLEEAREWDQKNEPYKPKK